MPTKPAAKAEVKPLKCKKHPRYGVLRKPRVECRDCWAMWLQKLAREQGVVARPATDDPSLMLGPLVDPIIDEDDDEDDPRKSGE